MSETSHDTSGATETVQRRPASGGAPPVEIVRSRRRRKTAAAHARDGVIVVRLPAGLPADEEERLIEELVDKVTRRDRVRAAGGDAALQARATELAETYLDGVAPTSVSWSSRMRRRWASCTPSEGTIRVSDAVAAFPDYVRDVILLHELVHLEVPDHSDAFRRLLDRHPEARRAQGFLEGIAHAQTQAGLPDDPLCLRGGGDQPWGSSSSDRSSSSDQCDAGESPPDG